MEKKLVIDTNVLIDYLRDYEPAVHYLEKFTSPLVLSVITVTELYGGIQNHNEEQITETLLSHCEILSVDNDIAVTAGRFFKKYNKSHGIGFADALIAATAQHQEAVLVTLNTRHFPMMETIRPYKR